MSKTSTAPAAKHRRRTAAAPVSGAKGGEQKPYTPYKAPDSALSIATVKLLYALSEGPIVGPVNDKQSVKLNGTPLISPDGSENFPGTVWDFRPGTVDQEHIAGFPAIENEASQGLPIELKSDNAWTRAITDQQLSAVRVRLSWPQIWQLKSNGDQIGYLIDYAIDLSVDGGSYQTVLSATLDDKGTTEYERTHRIDLPEGFTSALVRVRRLTANRNDSNYADLMRIKGLTEVIDKKLRYPNLALGGLRLDAKQFQDTPKASFLMRGRIVQVPTNYDASNRTYTGNWDGTFKLAYTNNPVWVWRDLLLHRRYGLGRRITADMVDHWTLYEIGRYCDVMVPDGKGGIQPRMTTNVYIQDSIEGYALLSDLASVFRGSSCWNGSKVTMVADIPGNEDGYVFTRSNIIGEFEYVAAAYPDRHTRAKVAWDNPENEFKTQPAPVTNEELIGALGHRMLDISRFACTVEGEAIRHGVWALKSEQYEEWSVSFTTGMEGRNVEPGQIICVADEMFSGRANGGRISAATKRVITLDIDAEVHEEDRLILNLPSGKSEGRIVKSVSGRLVTVMADYSELPEPECSWSVESADLAVMRFRVQTIEPQGLHQFKIAATQHEPQKYAAIDTGARIDPQPTSILPAGVMSPPENISIESRSIVSQGIAVTTMRITWDPVPGAIAYNVEWRKDSGSWIRLPRTGNLGSEVVGIYSGRYVARVSSVNAMDITSLWGTSVEVVLTGKTGLPPSVTHLTATPLLFGINLKWGFPAGAEDTQRTEIWYGPTTSLEAATKLADLAYPQSDYSMQSLQAGARFFFWARLIDRTGNVGPWYPAGIGVMGQASADAGPILDQIAGQIGETELGKDLLDRIDLIDGSGPGSVNERLQELQDEIGDLVDALEYQPEQAYAQDDAVRLGQRLYQAKQAVPAATDGSNSPPNPLYWLDIGQVVKLAEGTAAQVQQNTAAITTIDGKTTANAQQIAGVQTALTGKASTEALNSLGSTVTQQGGTIAAQGTAITGITSRLGTAETGIAGQAQALGTLDTKVTTIDGKVNAQATKLDGVFAQVNPALAGDSEGLAGSDQIYVGVWSEQTARIEDGVALGQRIDVVSASVGANAAAIQTETLARSSADGALASQITTVQAVANGASAAVQTVSQAQAYTNGKLSAIWSVKMELTANGQPYAAGFGLGLEGGASGTTSSFVVRADTFAVMNTSSQNPEAFFAITGGQSFIRSGFIQDGTITNAKIGSYISSTNYIAGRQGWILNKDGTLEINGIVPGQGRLVINSLNVSVYDANNVLRVRLGYLG